jgi:HSP20 family molecular chaperone IbpA
MRDTSRTSLQENVKMAVVRWNPWNDLFDLHAQMDHLFQPLAPATASRNGVEYTGLPVDIQQTDAAFVVEASVPGFNPADVEVTFEDGVLTITGRRSTSETSKDATCVASGAPHPSSARSAFPPRSVRKTSRQLSTTAYSASPCRARRRRSPSESQ